MKISEFSVKHPVILTMLLIVLMVFGFYSLSGMRTEFMEDISMPQAIVYTVYPGASAEDVENDITKVLEDSFVTLPHFKSIDSTSSNSLSWILITYADGYDPYDQLTELRNRISELVDDLPDGISGEPRALVGGMAMVPIISYSVSSGQDTARLTQYLQDELTPLLTQIDGVSQVSIDGGKELAVNIKLDVDALTSKGIAVSTVYQVLNYGNVTLPLGNASYQDRAIQVRYAGGFNSLEEAQQVAASILSGDLPLELTLEDYEIAD